MQRRWWVILGALVAMAGCGDDGGTSADDVADALVDSATGEDGAINEDTATVEDTAAVEDTTTVEDTATVEDTTTVDDTATVEDTTTVDDTATIDDTAVEDTATIEDTATVEDTTADDTATTVDVITPSGPEGQCAVSADCPGTLTCSRTAPGGLCIGCGGDDCPTGHVCGEFGSCNRPCSDDSGCPNGLRCHASQGVCVLKPCSDATPCDSPYVCDGGYCRRAPCVDGACEGGFVCVSSLCVEP